MKLMDFIKSIEFELNIISDKQMYEMQPSDVKKTWSDVNNMKIAIIIRLKHQ